MNTLTKKQAEVLKTIETYISKTSQSPTIFELKKELGVSSTRTITQYLETLEKKGFIARIKGKSRNIKLLDPTNDIHGETITLPVVGAAACGSLNVYAEESFNEFVQIAQSILGEQKQNEVIVIRALGLSMQDAGIEDGDLVLVELMDEVEEGDIIAAVIDGMAVIKKISFTKDAVILDPVTSIGSYKQIIMKKDFKVLGKVLHTIKAKPQEDIEIIPEKPQITGMI
ncbi:repressor LexA [bacterium]|nr:repressor LexA [bacterium]|tara:strand:- start:991 stop:1671 length:681 start_codon:yes stop_codon:yes gene_type:complete